MLFALFSNLQELVDTNIMLPGASGWNRSNLPTGQRELPLLVSKNKIDQALLAVDMVALELFWVCVGVQTDGALGLTLSIA